MLTGRDGGGPVLILGQAVQDRGDPGAGQQAGHCDRTYWPLSLQSESNLPRVLRVAPWPRDLDQQPVAGGHVGRDRCHHRPRRGPARRAVPDWAVRIRIPGIQSLRASLAMTFAPNPARSLGPERQKGPQQRMVHRGTTAAIVFLAVVLGVGCGDWRGPGFRAKGPEMPRLRHELTLAPGMSVADVGAGRGEMTVAIAAEIGSTGHVYADRHRPRGTGADSRAGRGRRAPERDDPAGPCTR